MTNAGERSVLNHTLSNLLLSLKLLSVDDLSELMLLHTLGVNAIFDCIQLTIRLMKVSKRFMTRFEMLSLMGFPDRESERPTAISHDDEIIRISEEDTVTLHGTKSTSSGGGN